MRLIGTISLAMLRSESDIVHADTATKSSCQTIS